MQNIMLCICTVTQSEYTGEDSILIGDDAGFVNLLVVGTEDLNLQKTKERNALQSQILDPRLLRRTILRRKLHQEWVLRVKYFPHLNSFVSCSSDSVHSVVLDDIRKLGDCQPIRTLSVPRGVNAFDYCVKANTFVTGGEDKIVRLWNPNMFLKPKALLSGHNCIITEVVINEADQHIISLSTEGMFRVWDIQTIAVLQVFILGEHQLDRHFNSMVFDHKHKRLIAGSQSIDLVPLTSAVQDSLQVPRSHERSINVLVYNKTTETVVTICSKSVIKVWNIRSGRKVYHIAEPHGHAVEVTAAAVDEIGNELVTGANDGSLITWELRSGEKIRSLPPVTESNEENKRISYLFYMNLKEVQMIIAVGWHNSIKIIQGGPDESYLSVLGTFPNIAKEIDNSLFPFKQRLSPSGQSNPKKQDDPDDVGLCGIDILECNAEPLLAIGWSNLIIVWNFEAASILQIFNEDRLSDTTDASEQNDLMMDVESSKVQVVKFIPVKRQFIEQDVPGGNTEIQSKESLGLLMDTSKLSILFKFAESFTTSEYSQAEQNQPAPAATEEIALLPAVEPNPILLSAHQDGSVQFWSLEGVQLDKILPTLQFCNPITAISIGETTSLVVAGNHKGYIIIWDIEPLFDNPSAPNKEPIHRIISWRAHILSIVSIVFLEHVNVVVSASVDSSVRVWYSLNGHYIGYFGQHSSLLLTNPSEFVLPSDITEAPVESKSKQSQKADQLDYPLMLDWKRWKPFDREGYLIKLQLQRKALDVDQDKKFFKSITLPRLKQKPMESSTSGTRAKGAVFRALPVYNMDPLFQVDQFKNIKFPEEKRRDSLHNIFAREKRATISTTKTVARGSILHPIQTCYIFNATTAPPPYVML
ncbi:WD repeat-containing protein 64-like [Leucoraja erinacea]|uniref:WD repeat-containing protein 64-like n=1 Tax=Leucoraja erinaceus TaxID=7782 RepID=UPI00245414BB|nr:WD repeat-containing protein 64-like [Leucoraja erinacea]